MTLQWYALLNARLGFKTKIGASFSIWVRNLLDQLMGLRFSAAPLHYRDSDAQDAPKVAAQIVAELGKSLSDKGDRSLPLLLAQVTTQLAADFEEVAAAARFLTRKQPTEAARFPNLFLASKRTRAPRPEPALDSDHQPQPPTG